MVLKRLFGAKRAKCAKQLKSLPSSRLSGFGGARLEEAGCLVGHRKWKGLQVNAKGKTPVRGKLDNCLSNHLLTFNFFSINN